MPPYFPKKPPKHSGFVDPVTVSIIHKWENHGAPFIRHIDGNKGNDAAANLQIVPLPLALEHVDDWAVDWDLFLTKEEIAKVRDPKWRAGLWYSKP
jgi:hypothetical protein